MADFTGNPLVFEAVDEAYPERVYVLAVELASSVTSGFAVFKDNKGRKVFTFLFDGQPPVQNKGELGWVDGLIADTLSGGTVNVYIR